MRVELLRALVRLQHLCTGRVYRRCLFRPLRLGLTLAISAALVAACGKASSPPPPAPAAAPVKKAEIAGVGIYRAALAAQDNEEALRLLEQAVRANPRLAEAWYEVGRQKVRLAPDIVKLDELRGIQVFREGLEAEKEALRLLDAGTVTVWNAAEEDQARATLQTELANVDETLADQESLLRALRVRTY
jgi:tetratricopeptide (TPR) repeat protein